MTYRSRSTDEGFKRLVQDYPRIVERPPFGRLSAAVNRRRLRNAAIRAGLDGSFASSNDPKHLARFEFPTGTLSILRVCQPTES